MQIVDIDRTLERLQVAPIAVTTEAQHAAEGRLEALASAIAMERASIERANAAAGEAVRRRQEGDRQADDWRTSRDYLMLNDRADEAEHYAATCFELAGAAIREAAHAVMAAALARNDADVASLPQRRPPE